MMTERKIVHAESDPITATIGCAAAGFYFGIASLVFIVAVVTPWVVAFALARMVGDLIH